MRLGSDTEPDCRKTAWAQSAANKIATLMADGADSLPSGFVIDMVGSSANAMHTAGSVLEVADCIHNTGLDLDLVVD